jgi:hypothetical protein
VSSGGSLVLLVLLWGQLLHPIVVMLLAIANLSAICGVRARRLWLCSASRAALMLLVPLTALALVVVTAVPGLATRIATRQMSAAAPLFFDQEARRRGAEFSGISGARGRPGLLGHLVPGLSAGDAGT